MELEQRSFRLSCVSSKSDLRGALESLSVSGVGIVLIIDNEGKLAGVLTNGDCRRAILKGVSLDHPINDLMVKVFASVSCTDDRATVLDYMRSLYIQQLPILDSSGKPVGIHLIQEMLANRSIPNAAVVFVGGKGERLRPITEHIPKPMVKVAGRPILERIVLQLNGQGIKEIYLAVNYLQEVIEDYFGDGSAFGCNIHYIREDQPLGTAGALALYPGKPKHPVIAMNGDIISHFSVEGILETQKKADADVVIGSRDYVHQIPFGCLEVKNEQILKIEEKPEFVHEISAGIYVIHPRVWDFFPEGAFSMTELFDVLLGEKGKLVRFHLEENWIDVGNPIDLSKAKGEVD